MKIPGSLGFFVNYHAYDNLDGLRRSINHEPQSWLVRLWNKVVQLIPFIGKNLMVKCEKCQCNNKNLYKFEIKIEKDMKPYISGINHSAGRFEGQDFHLLPVPHSQQTSLNGCGDACLDMLGCYFECESLKCPESIRSDGLRRMPEPDKPFLEGMSSWEFSEALQSAGLKKKDLGPATDEEVIKRALECGPIVLSIKFAFGLGEHFVVIVGYHGDHVIVNDPWHGGHLIKSMDWLFDHLNNQPSPSFMLVTKTQ